MMPGGPPPLPSERVEAELAYLKTALKITPEQTGEWNEVADVLRQMARHRDARVLAMRAALDNGAAAAGPITALERRQAGLTEESHDLAELIAAAKPLYARLSADQKKAAEWFLAPPRDGFFLERRRLPDLGRLPPLEPPLPE
jgi:hypothetical protein